MSAAGSCQRASCRRALIFGVLCAGSGAVVGLAVSAGATGQGWGGLSLYAAAAAGLTAMPLWWFLMERRRRFGAMRGALIGALAGLLAHYPCWYLAILGGNFSYWVLGHAGSSLGEPPVDPLGGLSGALALSLWSWLLLGWLTVIIGAVTGGAYARIVDGRFRSRSAG